ncbi:MAG: DHA2 family efflux MFS transporter permease subunit [Simkaniaceae bacterium]|nr:DHA2 family efflux MFS transporter permease subunit [Candidatus Sacchlamyda saccharinae]
MEAATPRPLTGSHLFLAMLALSLATFLIVLDYSIANVSIPYIAGDLAVSATEGTYVITSFAVGSAIGLPITGWLTKRVGIVRLTVWSLLGFISLSWVCGISWNLEMLVVARFIQGLAAGPLVPTSQSLTVMIFPPEKKNKALAFWSTVVVVAPIVGPIVGGYISYDIRWPWIFFINIPIGLFAAFIIHSFLKPFETAKEKIATDWVGLLLLAIGVSCLQFLLDKGEQYDWFSSPIISSCAAISVICFTYLIAWQFTAKNPLLDLRLFKIPSFTVSILYIATMYAIYFGGVILVPLWLQEYMGYTPIWAGVAVAPIGIMPALFSGVIAKIVSKIGAIIPLGISVILFAISSFDGAYFTTNVDLWHIAFSRFLFGLGMLFFIVPLFHLSVRDIPTEKLPSSTGMFHFVRAMMGGVGTSIFTTLWIRRSAFHHANQVAAILPSREPVAQLYSQMDHLRISGDKAQAVVNEMATNQGALLGLNDCFYVMGWIFIGMLAILLIGKRKKETA